MVIFFYGEDSLRSSQKLQEIKEKYLTSDKSGSGLSLFDLGEKVVLKDIINTFETPNLLSPKRLVVVKRFMALAKEDEQKEMREFLKKSKKWIIDDKNLVVIFWEEGEVKKSNALFKFLSENAKKQGFEKLTGIKISQWALKRIKEIDPKASISKVSLEKLVAYAGQNMHVLDSEIKKLADYCDGKMIGEKDVESLVKANLDSNIFATIDAISSNNKKEALKLLHRHLKNGEDPFYLLSMFSYQFKNLLKISDLKERGIANEYEISKITKMHPYVIKKSLGQMRNFSFSRLKNIYCQLGEMDKKIKTGKLDIKLALDKFVAEL